MKFPDSFPQLCIGDIIQLDSFENYQDQLRAAQAFVNRLCPGELILNLSEKCLLLIEEINRLAKIEEPYIVSKYLTTTRSALTPFFYVLFFLYNFFIYFFRSREFNFKGFSRVILIIISIELQFNCCHMS